MRKIFHFTAILATFLQISCSRHDMAPEVEPTTLQTGSNWFDYTYSGLSSRPLRVFYHIPPGDRTNMPVVMVFHGDERNAEDYRDIWVQYANQHGFMVFAPEFSEQYYPGGNYYILGNVFTDGNNPVSAIQNPESQWTFSVIEPLFDEIKQKTGATAETYEMFGHSGGGQFVHRFVMFKPNARFNNAIASNSGWYTVPDAAVNFPYGTAISPLAATPPANYFARKLTVQVGALDNNGSDPSLRHNQYADAQGLNRLDRATYYFQKSQAGATSLSVPFNWQFRTVANAGHDPALTSRDAVNVLFP
ncbi:MAG: hypothetical protein ACO1N9_08380 [Flavobacterium sp.]